MNNIEAMKAMLEGQTVLHSGGDLYRFNGTSFVVHLGADDGMVVDAEDFKHGTYTIKDHPTETLKDKCIRLEQEVYNLKLNTVTGRLNND